MPKVKEGGYKSLGNRSSEVRLIRLQSGVSLLNSHMHKILPQIYTSPNCRCGLSRETVEHFLIDCPLHTSPRASLCDCIELTFMKYNVPFNKRLINMQVLIGEAEYLPTAVKTKVRTLVVKFILATQADI